MGVVNFAQTALDAVFPQFCLRCSLEGELLCSDCRSAVLIETLAHKCPFCDCETGSGSTCRRCCSKTGLDGCLALSHYAEPAVKRVIKNWKYDSNRKSEVIIQTWLRRTNVVNILQDLPWKIVPVPLHSRRERLRGFDQTVILSNMIGEVLSLPVTSCLKRKKRSISQARLGTLRRQVGELRGSFECVSEPPEYVLLVDDVLTTGTTLDAAAETLRAAGSDLVWGLVLARG